MVKKGASIILMIFEVLVVVIVAALMISAAKKFGQSDTIVRVTIAEDLALMVNTLVSIPGDAIVKYPINVSKYTIMLDTTFIEVKNEGESGITTEKRRIALPEAYQGEGIVQLQEWLCLKKKGKTI